jgi:glycosyltransferase involved in cell wall biosynthesis
MWEVLEYFPALQRIVWVHGAEIQPWHRREYNYRNEQERAKAIFESEKRMAFWRGILNPLVPNLKLVFVSRYFAEEVMEDLGFRLPESAYTIIHNPIDTDLFAYHPKPVEQRKKILSIRPYASHTYANDLSVKAILKLSERPFFKDMEFRMIGDGKLFDETLEPLRKFSNVTIERRFLTQPEIAALHQQYGVFLVPTRMDSQGVSRDEAMASGLVPVTSAVAAVPEFVDEGCGILADAEDAEGLARGIADLYEHPDRFLAMSQAASRQVLGKTAKGRQIQAELQLFAGKDANA